MSKKKNIKIEIPIDEIVKKWEQGTIQTELAKEYGVSVTTINKRIAEYYEKIGKPKLKIKLPINEIARKWEQGSAKTKLAKEYDVSLYIINSSISEYYQREEKKIPKKELNPKIELPIDEIAKKWEQGATQRGLAKEYGVSSCTINKRISEYYEKIEKTNPKIKLQIDKIGEKWKQGATQKELAKEYGVARTTIDKRISE